MKRVVLDSYALIAFLFGEHGREKISELLEWASENNKPHQMSVVNWAELCYIIQRKTGPEEWQKIRDRLSGLPIELIDVDVKTAECAGQFKLKSRISLADCFTAALALQKNMPIVTGDPEFKRLEKELSIIWI